MTVSIRDSVLLTGASSGIGLEMAREFARHGHDLVLVARRLETLQTISRELKKHYGIRCVEICTDLSEIGAARKIYHFCQKHGLKIDVLVNNAGFGAHGRFCQLSLDEQVNILKVNVIALTELSRLFLPFMLERGRGGIINVASTGAFQPGPYTAVYYASKAYVFSLTYAIAHECAGSGVTTCCLAPGPVDTPFRERAGMPRSRGLRKLAEMSAERVAREGYRGFRRGKTLIVPGLLNKISTFSVRFTSWRAAAGLAARINKPDSKLLDS